MRDFLVQRLPDPGAVIFLIALGLIFFVLFRMITDDRRYDEPVEHDTTPTAPEPVLDPETDVRSRGF